MISTFLKSKLHMGTVTACELWYDGSIAIDEDLVNAAGMQEYEQIDVYNATNGKRWTTYIILAPKGSGVISVNGPGARNAMEGDRVVLCTYVATESLSYTPNQKYLNTDNTIIE